MSKYIQRARHQRTTGITLPKEPVVVHRTPAPAVVAKPSKFNILPLFRLPVPETKVLPAVVHHTTTACTACGPQIVAANTDSKRFTVYCSLALLVLIVLLHLVF